MDKRNFSSNEDVVLKVCIKNISSKNISFNIYESGKIKKTDFTTFQPYVYDMYGRDAQLIVPYRLQGKRTDHVLSKMKKRNIILGPEEIIIHRVNLNQIYKLNAGLKYRVKSFFLPDFGKKIVIKSINELSFKVKRAKRDRKKQDRLDIKRGLTPSETVLLALDAEKGKDWSRMIKHYDIEKYINSYPDYIRIYNLADRLEKQKIEKKFINYLSRKRFDYLLNFKIVNDEIDKNRRVAYVDVLVKRFGVIRHDKYKYRFTLEKYIGHKDLWLITGYEATVLR
ncbi:hypothetical protein ACFL20_01800 [Spirochaetota bacterium]